jgi:DNA ligase-4
MQDVSAPVNHSPLPPFHSLVSGLFRPLQYDLHSISVATRKPVNEVRNEIIRQFIKKWRANVGNDIYPAFRLILPDQDKERQMYG